MGIDKTFERLFAMDDGVWARHASGWNPGRDPAAAAARPLEPRLDRLVGAKGITVNCVQPGLIDTDMNPADGDLAAVMTPLIPVGRYGRAEEIAATVAFLASPAASNLTGAMINVDGGFEA